MMEVTAKTPSLSYLKNLQKGLAMAQPIEEPYWELHDYDKGRNVLRLAPPVPEEEVVDEPEYQRRNEKTLYALRNMRGDGVINLTLLEKLLEGKA